MKKHFKLVLLVALFTCTTLPAWSQASTQGKEFWVTLTIGDNNENKKEFKPYIAISSKKACHVTITNPRTNYKKELDVAANDWTTEEVPLTEWYPSTDTNNDHDPNYSENKYDNGLLIESTEDISVYVANRMKYSFDASNILPVTALGSEYYTQDYPPSEQRSVFTILATEDETKIDITPTAETVKGQTEISITLQRGETYHVMSKSETATLTGTHIFAHDNKKIAVFLGCVRTRIPSDKAARDLLYEQALPIDLWGTTFVVTRSKDRNADRVRITAGYDDTKITIDGITVTGTFKAGETYEFELSDGTVHSSSGSKTPAPYVCTNEAVYVETSCPCAVYLYATGQDYDKPSSGLGDPYMVWISPLEQMASEITFGACPTNQTTEHYANIITRKDDVSSLELLAHENNFMNQIKPEDFKPVPTKPDYYYALIKLGSVKGDGKKLTFTLKGGRFIAHIYGHGDQESYAYSAGSSILKNSMIIEGVPMDTEKPTDKKFCINETLEFTPYAEGNFIVTQMHIDFGDGVTLDTTVLNPQLQEKNISVEHKYTSPGWYDVVASYGGHKKCPEGAFIDLGSVSFSFRVVRTDTVTGSVAERICINPDSTLADGTKLTAEQVAELLVNGENEIVPVGEPLIGGCYDTVLVNYHPYGLETIEETTTLNLEILPGEESVYCPELKKSLTSSVEDTVITTNEYGCNHYHPYFVKVKACLYMNLEKDPKLLSVCEGQTLEVGYKKRGDVENARLIIEPQSVAWLDNTSTNTTTNEAPVPPASEDMTVPNPVIDLAFSWTDGINDGIIHENPDGSGTLVLPTQTLKPGIYDLTLELTDASEECLNTDTFLTRTITIKYPESVVVQKFVNVLAVLNAQYNGGYDFVGFQWYKNGEILTGETGAVYHTIAPFSVGDTYSVELTDAAGNKLPSCDFEIKTEPGYNTIQKEGEEEPAQKLIQNNRIVIRRDGQTYNIFGQKVR